MSWKRPRTFLLGSFGLGVASSVLPAELRVASVGAVALFGSALFGRSAALGRSPMGLAAGVAAIAGGVAIGLVGGLQPTTQFNKPSGARAVAPVTGISGALQARARRAFDQGPGGDVGALMVGMAMGDDSGLSATTRDQFRRSSMTHVTAASGQNIALLLALVAPMLMALGLGFRLRLVAAALLVVAYVPFCGGQAPIQRAAVMGIAALVGSWTGVRRRPSLAPVLLAGVVTVLFDPSSPWKLGWQLSFAAVIGMVALGGPLAARLQRFGLRSMFAEPLALAFAATAATTPLIAHAAGRLSVTAIPANLMSAPAVGLAMAAGLAACLLAQISVAAASVAVWAGSLPAAAVLEIARIAGSPEWAAKQWQPSVLFTLALLGVVVSSAIWLRLEGQRRRLVEALCLSGALVAVVVTRIESGALPTATGPRIVFMSVGQGDAELVADGDSGILVDVGPPGAPIASELRRLGIKHLRAVLITHGQADHAGGLADLLAGLPPDLVIDGSRTAPGGESEPVADALKRFGVRSVPPHPGQRITVGAASLELLAPNQQAPVGADPNDSSAVAIARAGSLSALLTADSESPSLERLPLGHVDVFKIPHHGSSDPGLGSILQRVTPLMSVVEVGRNSYGHPTKQAITEAKRWGPVWRTDLSGHVTISPRPEGGIAVDHR